MLQFLKSTVGRKYLMGLTGLVWMGFIFGHMAGNMLIFVSADAFNAYGHAIVSNKLLLYGTEAVLSAAILVHIVTAISLTIENRKSKGSRYAVAPNKQKAPVLASRFMAAQGSAILAFIIIHLITFKYGQYYETTVNGVVMRDLHKLVVESFQVPAYTVWYLVALVLLFFHLSHGAASIFQSFGFLERKMQSGIKKFAWAYAIVVAGGFISQPLYVFFFYR
ncbi:succinate dehydrogenase cytochrome b subunit [Pseudobdellovibrio exovorus]|uniref:Putative cytochrome B subunit n=1 Tax=Pseudobdellovibrio exovorus JSS TaxID=1184267 RepID=M4VMD1_9BACT|nr:succinate dehydrogenase cytochrome b subunit [Pseudobdellovibrio exovorus]AGH94239.1 putative cytochrome B subunit [Pseudobdellovibrio exovorus JSS]